MNNSLKGGLVEKAIIHLIKTNKSPFGKFDNILTIDCFLNNFKNKSYEFNKKERRKKIIKLKYYKNLKNLYEEYLYDGKPTLFIPFLSNSKEWDIGYLIKNVENGKIDLCLVQISINKSIKKIQQMLMNFYNKKTYIKKKYI